MKNSCSLELTSQREMDLSKVKQDIYMSAYLKYYGEHKEREGGIECTGWGQEVLKVIRGSLTG